MRPDGIEIRAYRAGDETGITAGLELFAGRPVALEEWSWAYPPRTEGRSIVVALAEGEVVAHVGGVVGQLQLSNRQIPAASLVDSFAVTAEVARDPRDLTAEVFEAFLHEFGHRYQGGLVYRLRTNPWFNDSRDLSNVTTTDLPPVDVMLRQRGGRSGARRLAYRAEPARDWEPRLDDLWGRVSRDYPTAVVRNAEMALRRHAGHPTVRCHCFLIFPRFSRHPAAYVVFEADDNSCRWVDLVWDHSRPGALDMVAHLSDRLAAQVGSCEEIFVLGGDPEGRARLESLGFRSDECLEHVSLTILGGPPGINAGDVANGLYVTSTDLDPLRRTG